MMNSNFIPKKIHYCWFGGNPLPELAIKCIESWKKILPDYDIIEWNESNYDVHKIPYISEAYDAKKYAFVSDYARFDILYEYGGIYFDTDVEVIKDMTDIITAGSFAGIESPGNLNVGLGFASYAENKILKEVLASYQTDHFVKEDGSLNWETVVTRVSNIFSKYGFSQENIIQKIEDFTIYPVDYFAPKDVHTGKLQITANSVSIHHYDGSWCTPAQKQYDIIREKLYAHFPEKFARLIVLFPFVVWQIKDNGFYVFLKKVWRKITK